MYSNILESRVCNPGQKQLTDIYVLKMDKIVIKPGENLRSAV